MAVAPLPPPPPLTLPVQPDRAQVADGRLHVGNLRRRVARLHADGSHFLRDTAQFRNDRVVPLGWHAQHEARRTLVGRTEESAFLHVAAGSRRNRRSAVVCLSDLLHLKASIPVRMIVPPRMSAEACVESVSAIGAAASLDPLPASMGGIPGAPIAPPDADGAMVLVLTAEQPLAVSTEASMTTIPNPISIRRGFVNIVSSSNRLSIDQPRNDLGSRRQRQHHARAPSFM